MAISLTPARRLQDSSTLLSSCCLFLFASLTRFFPLDSAQPTSAVAITKRLLSPKPGPLTALHQYTHTLRRAGPCFAGQYKDWHSHYYSTVTTITRQALHPGFQIIDTPFKSFPETAQSIHIRTHMHQRARVQKHTLTAGLPLSATIASVDRTAAHYSIQ